MRIYNEIERRSEELKPNTMPINYNLYPKNWKEIRQRILARADNKCEICKVPDREIICRGFYNDIPVWQDEDGKICSAENGEELGYNYVGEVCMPGKEKFIKVVLTISHLDHDVANHDVKDERLMAMCQKCHLNYDAIFRKQNRKKKNMIDLFNISK